MANVREDKTKFGTSQLLNFSKGSYLERTSRPIYALMFLLPFMIFYQISLYFISASELPKSPLVAFDLLQQVMELIGFSGKFSWATPPFVVIVILIWLQITSKNEWKVFATDFLPMVVESILFAIPLLVLLYLINTGVVRNASILLEQSVATSKEAMFNSIVTSIGAGIYEELIFRLFLLCFLMIFFQDLLKIDHTNSIILSVLISAALFSAFHHIHFLNGEFTTGEVFTWAAFLFRTIAGIYFATIFAIRGFGITVVTHAFYNILVVLVYPIFFTGK